MKVCKIILYLFFLVCWSCQTNTDETTYENDPASLEATTSPEESTPSEKPTLPGEPTPSEKLTPPKKPTPPKEPTDDDKIEDEYEKLIGKWKPVKKTRVFCCLDTFDLSQYNIIWEFQSNGILTISGMTEDINNASLENGEYPYAIIPNRFRDNPPYLLELLYFEFYYYISSDELEINGSYCDGHILNLVKIE